MTSTLPEHLFDHLDDIRDKYEDDEYFQNFLLSRTYPHEFSTWLVATAPSDKFKFNINLDAAVVILRHLYSMVNTFTRYHEQTKVQEKSHPILRFIWADFQDDSDESVKAQSVIRHEMQVLDDPSGQATVYDLLERHAMWNTLWARKPFQLFHPTVLGRPQGAKKWDIIKHHPDIVKSSLVRWDGAQPLGDRISGMFGQGVSRKTGSQFVYMFNDPAIIRVRYEHTAQEQSPATYEDLRHIYIHPHRRKHRKNEKDEDVFIKDKETQEERVLYTLVAIVRCSRQADEADRIRLYSVIGSPLSLPIALKQYVGKYWNLGDADPGRVYLLFYANAPPDIITGQHGEPIAREQPDTAQLIRDMKASIIPIKKTSK
ncbi:hypothetical protein GGR51DRAFT_515487 [Nemania sp. FL0031]|nr:hypothetical protein GGR51DRAFT_515487 [Nemania sp. FL0031]